MVLNILRQRHLKHGTKISFHSVDSVMDLREKLCRILGHPRGLDAWATMCMFELPVVHHTKHAPHGSRRQMSLPEMR